MKDTARWMRPLHGQLGHGEEVRSWLGGEFIDKPKSIRTGILAATNRRLVFFRKKLFGEEFVDLGPAAAVVSAELGVFDNLLVNGRGVGELRLRLADGSTVTMTLIQHGDPAALCGALGVELLRQPGTA